MASVEMDFDPLAPGPFADETPSRDRDSGDRSVNQNPIGDRATVVDIGEVDGNVEQGAETGIAESDRDSDIDVHEDKPNPYVRYFSGKPADYDSGSSSSRTESEVDLFRGIKDLLGRIREPREVDFSEEESGEVMDNLPSLLPAKKKPKTKKNGTFAVAPNATSKRTTNADNTAITAEQQKKQRMLTLGMEADAGASRGGKSPVRIDVPDKETGKNVVEVTSSSFQFSPTLKSGKPVLVSDSSAVAMHDKLLSMTGSIASMKSRLKGETKLRAKVEKQNSRSVDDYTTEFHQLVARNDLAETEEQLVSRYVGGLREQFQFTLNMLELFPVSDAYQKALQIEKQASRRPSSTPWSTTARPTVGNTSAKQIASLPPTTPPAIRAGAGSGFG
ncbi:hypothetical protein Vadar_008643 [Vaccinium darrowii]|uniref:Uncharacterized protein n=1 Tax=Vaccinium darrowii TaxID=229202 RepID=A0ACB7Z393_9ERIC|nr:hypothetical protein Vadar_008643 [Vaccinium darrowii]